jgi:hypothetical protein
MTRQRHVLQGHLGAVFCFGWLPVRSTASHTDEWLTPATFLKDSRNGSA